MTVRRLTDSQRRATVTELRRYQEYAAYIVGEDERALRRIAATLGAASLGDPVQQGPGDRTQRLAMDWAEQELAHVLALLRVKQTDAVMARLGPVVRRIVELSYITPSPGDDAIAADVAMSVKTLRRHRTDALMRFAIRFGIASIRDAAAFDAYGPWSRDVHDVSAR